MADIDRSLTPLPPPVVPADALVSGVLDTPPLVATTGPSPVLEALVSPALDAADKDGFSLDSTDTWRMPQCWGHRGVSPDLGHIANADSFQGIRFIPYVFVHNDPPSGLTNTV